MSVVSFTLNEKGYSFKCNIQLTDKCKAEEDLNILVKQYMKACNLEGIPIKIKMVDDNGNVASVENFRDRGSIKVIIND